LAVGELFAQRLGHVGVAGAEFAEHEGGGAADFERLVGLEQAQELLVGDWHGGLTGRCEPAPGSVRVRESVSEWNPCYRGTVARSNTAAFVRVRGVFGGGVRRPTRTHANESGRRVSRFISFHTQRISFHMKRDEMKRIPQ